jgi:hypothetical protein
MWTAYAEPNVGYGAGAQTVNALESVGTNNGIGDASTVLENEDSVIRASVLIRVARLATVKLAVTKVLASSDDARLRERDDLAYTARDVESLSGSKAGNKGCQLCLGELHGD